RCSPSLRHYPLGLGTPQAMKNKSKKQSWRKTSCAPYLKRTVDNSPRWYFEVSRHLENTVFLLPG
ncbi:mCG1046397, isoform CRA_c, partial [Mus musculus]